MPGTSRLVWVVILAQREGLSLLFVRRPDEKYSHTLAIRMENVPERVFETLDASQFYVEHDERGTSGCVNLEKTKPTLEKLHRGYGNKNAL